MLLEEHLMTITKAHQRHRGRETNSVLWLGDVTIRHGGGKKSMSSCPLGHLEVTYAGLVSHGLSESSLRETSGLI